jgi:hypothetical protein
MRYFGNCLLGDAGGDRGEVHGGARHVPRLRQDRLPDRQTRSRGAVRRHLCRISRVKSLSFVVFMIVRLVVVCVCLVLQSAADKALVHKGCLKCVTCQVHIGVRVCLLVLFLFGKRFVCR